MTQPSAPQTLIISNRGDLDLKIDDIVLTGDTGFSLDSNQCKGKTLISQDECTVDVRLYAIGSRRDRSRDPVIFSNDRGCPK